MCSLPDASGMRIWRVLDDPLKNLMRKLARHASIG
jgi:hypothetical protein